MGFSKAGASILAGAVCGAYLVTKKNELKFYHYDIESSRVPDGFDGFRILHLSDLHGKSYGKDGIYLTHACEDVRPDIIVFTGDLYSRSENIFTLRKKIPLMKRLNEIAPVYYVWGNHEADIPEKAALMNGRLADEGITILRNERLRIYSGNNYINIYGLELGIEHYRNADGSYKNLAPVTGELIHDKLGQADNDGFNILLAHTPLPFTEYADWGADLTLSGHIHGGIVRLPGGIGLLSPERKFFPKYSKGLYMCENEDRRSFMEVSAGLGKFRLANPESASVCVLRKTGK